MMRQPASKQFLSTPSARRATFCGDRRERGCRISIHALREEGDAAETMLTNGCVIFLYTPSARRATGLPAARGRRVRYFYPRPPRGGRPVPMRILCDRCEFLSTPSARRATAKTETKSLFSYKLYNILHEFRRALIYNGSKNYPNHAK